MIEKDPQKDPRNFAWEELQEKNKEKEEREQKETEKRRKEREQKKVDWFELEQVASFIKEYVQKEDPSGDKYMEGVLVDGDCVLYEEECENKDGLPEDIKKAGEQELVYVEFNDGMCKVTLSEKTKENYRRYKELKESWE